MKTEPIVIADIPAVIEVIKESFLRSVAPDWSDQAVKIFLIATELPLALASAMASVPF